MGDDEQISPVLSWSHDLVHLPRKRADADHIVVKEATADELADVCAALGIHMCKTLKVSYAVSARARGRFVMSGNLKSDVVQSCVVSLEPVPEALNENFTVEFWPSDQLDVTPGEEIELGPDDLKEHEIEPIYGASLEAGRVIYEVLAAGLKTYPRADGVTFDPSEIGAAEVVERENPFAILAKMKEKD